MEDDQNRRPTKRKTNKIEDKLNGPIKRKTIKMKDHQNGNYCHESMILPFDYHDMIFSWYIFSWRWGFSECSFKSVVHRACECDICLLLIWFLCLMWIKWVWRKQNGFDPTNRIVHLFHSAGQWTNVGYQLAFGLLCFLFVLLCFPFVVVSVLCCLCLLHSFVFLFSLVMPWHLLSNSFEKRCPKKLWCFWSPRASLLVRVAYLAACRLHFSAHLLG